MNLVGRLFDQWKISYLCIYLETVDISGYCVSIVRFGSFFQHQKVTLKQHTAGTVLNNLY
jgi:hypothetical protein